MKSMIQYFTLLLLCSALSCTTQSKPEETTLISRIQKSLPDDWTCFVKEDIGQKGHPHGLMEPVFRADFINPNEQLPNNPIHQHLREYRKQNPIIQLYFYPISSKPHVVEVIHKESLYSWNIPIYFGETKDYIIVTSPSYVNTGIFTKEAKKLIYPMWDVLRKHIPNKEDKSIDGLADWKLSKRE